MSGEKQLAIPETEIAKKEETLPADQEWLREKAREMHRKDMEKQRLLAQEANEGEEHIQEELNLALRKKSQETIQ